MPIGEVTGGTHILTFRLDAFNNTPSEVSLNQIQLKRDKYILKVSKAGTGSGVITSSPAGIECGAACQEAYALGAVVTLTATPVSSTFAGWSGDPDCADGQVALDTDKTCIATFTLLPPAKATLIAPKSTITDNTPTYQWNAVPGAAKYRLKVQDSKGVLVIGQWYTAAQAGCGAGTGTCAVTPARHWPRAPASGGSGPGTPRVTDPGAQPCTSR